MFEEKTRLLELADLLPYGMWVTRNKYAETLKFWGDKPSWHAKSETWLGKVTYGVVPVAILGFLGIQLPSYMQFGGVGAMLAKPNPDPNPTCPSCGIEVPLVDTGSYYHARSNNSCILEGVIADRERWDRRPDKKD